jgi:hypothetical protein
LSKLTLVDDVEVEILVCKREKKRKKVNKNNMGMR